MASNAERRRHPRTKALPSQRDLTLIYGTPDGPSVLEARCRDYSEGGIQLEVETRLPLGATVEIVGDIEGVNGAQPLRRRGTVRRCAPTGFDRYLVDLSYESILDGSSPEAVSENGDAPDYYEILQLSRNASPDTIQRVFRLLAKRYHPDNAETGNPELFRQVVEAARVLTDPQLRAAYDARLGRHDKHRFKILETWQSSQGVEAEKRKRRGVLSLLYGRRITDPQHPTLGMRDFEEMLECPREHFEFTLWFLKESKWIRMADNSRFEITLQGAIVAEEEREAQPLRRMPLQLAAHKGQE